MCLNQFSNNGERNTPSVRWKAIINWCRRQHIELLLGTAILTTMGASACGGVVLSAVFSDFFGQSWHHWIGNTGRIVIFEFILYIPITSLISIFWLWGYFYPFGLAYGTITYALSRAHPKYGFSRKLLIGSTLVMGSIVGIIYHYLVLEGPGSILFGSIVIDIPPLVVGMIFGSFYGFKIISTRYVKYIFILLSLWLILIILGNSIPFLK